MQVLYACPVKTFNAFKERYDGPDDAGKMNNRR